MGGLYNMDTRKTGFRSDFALHYVVDYQWWNLKIHKLFLDSICLYNDFSLLNKRIAGFNDSLENVTGCSLTMGKVFSYIDYAVGRNHAWLGDVWDEAFARGTEDNWNVKFNINIGYYF